jgi:hypothetical protein
MARRGDEPCLFVLRIAVTQGWAGALGRLAVPGLRACRHAAWGGLHLDSSTLGPGQVGILADTYEGRVDLRINTTATADPAAPASALALDLYSRHSIYFVIRGGYLWSMPISVPEGTLKPASIERVRLPLWQSIGLLTQAETQSPCAVVAAESLAIHTGMPRPSVAI